MALLSDMSDKQKHKIKIIIIISVVAAVIFAGSYFFDNKKNKNKQAVRQQQNTPQKKMSLLTEKVEKDLWVASEGHNIQEVQASNKDLKQAVDTLQQQMKEMQAQNTALKNEAEKKPKETKKFPPMPLAKALETGQKGGPPPIPPAPGTAAAAGGDPSKKPGTVRNPSNPNASRLPGPPGLSSQGGGGIREFKDDAKDSEKKTSQSDAAKEKKDAAYIPAGSFMKVVLLNGIDAAASETARSEPYPVLMDVTDLSVLPNRFRMNLKECMIIGAGYGNLSDERAYIRIEKLSCVRTDGKVIDAKLKGHVIGEDGKLGMRGRLVSKQGQQIAMSLFAGTLGGLGTALRPQQSVAVNLSPGTNNGVVYPRVSDVLADGAMGGAGQALDSVAKYYLKMAEKMFPIIEIDAGRKVEVMILDGQHLTKQ